MPADVRPKLSWRKEADDLWSATAFRGHGALVCVTSWLNAWATSRRMHDSRFLALSVVRRTAERRRPTHLLRSRVLRAAAGEEAGNGADARVVDRMALGAAPDGSERMCAVVRMIRGHGLAVAPMTAGAGRLGREFRWARCSLGPGCPGAWARGAVGVRGCAVGCACLGLLVASARGPLPGGPVLSRPFPGVPWALGPPPRPLPFLMAHGCVAPLAYRSPRGSTQTASFAAECENDDDLRVEHLPLGQGAVVGPPDTGRDAPACGHDRSGIARACPRGRRAHPQDQALRECDWDRQG